MENAKVGDYYEGKKIVDIVIYYKKKSFEENYRLIYLENGEVEKI